MNQKEKLEKYKKHFQMMQEGYGGILPTGELVDRREHPEALEIAENSFLGIGKPKKITTDEKR